LLAACFTATAAHAVTVTEYFSGTIVVVQNPVGVSSSLSSLFQVGQAFSGSFTYDTLFPPVDMTPYCGTPTCSNYQLYNQQNSGEEFITASFGPHQYSSLGGANGEITISHQLFTINFFRVSGPTSGSLQPSYVAFTTYSIAPVRSFSWPPGGFTSNDFFGFSLSVFFGLPGCDANGACYFAVVGQIHQISTAPPVAVAIDIKPGSLTNSINPRSQGRIPVAILTTDTLDAATVDPTTVLFGRTGIEATPVRSALEDVDGDGIADMILHFNTSDTGIQCDDTSASLSAKTFSGRIIQGSDSVKTVGCK
jgi:hypothetical protein